MKNIIAIIFLFSFFDSNAQVFYRKSEFGMAGGSSLYFGDLNTDLSVKDAGISGGIFYKYNITKYIALKLGGAFAHVAADDKNSSNYYQNQRNLNFKDNISEVSFATEFHFFKYKIGDFENRFTPYVTLGIGMFWYSPYTSYEGKNYFLRPLGTEGQNYEAYKDRRYGKRAMSVPLGIGFKFWMTKGVTLNLEVANRLTTTDYIDDVSATYVGIDKFQDNTPSPYPSVAAMLQDRSNSGIGVIGRQRGISSTKDQFMTMQIGISFRLPTYKCPDDM